MQTAYGSADAPGSTPDQAEDPGVFRSTFTDAKTWLSAGVAFVTGWTNAIFFVRYKAFATMMTGNMLALAFSTALQLEKRGGKPYIPEPDSPWLVFSSPLLYLTVILMSWFGAVLYKVLVNKRGWKASTFAPVMMLGFMTHEFFSWLWAGYELHNSWHVAFFSMICGVMNSVSLANIKALPYMTTGNMMQLGHLLADAMTLPKDTVTRQDLQSSLVFVTMFVAVQLGAISGIMVDTLTSTTMDWELTMISPLLGIIWYSHDYLRTKPLLPD